TSSKLTHCVTVSICSSTWPGHPETYTPSLHDALPISRTTRPTHRRTSRPPRPTRASPCRTSSARKRGPRTVGSTGSPCCSTRRRSEEHTSELQSHLKLVSRLLPETTKTDTSTPSCPIF